MERKGKKKLFLRFVVREVAVEGATVYVKSQRRER